MSVEDEDLQSVVAAAFEEQPEAEPSTEPVVEAVAEEIEPPHPRWPKEWQQPEEWNSLAPTWRQRMLSRENELHSSLTENGRRLSETQRQAQELGQWREQHGWAEKHSWVPKVFDDALVSEFATAGVAPDQAVQQMVQVWRALQNPATSQQVVLQLAQRYGVTPEVMQQRTVPVTPEQQMIRQEAEQLRQLRLSEEQRIKEREERETSERRARLAPVITEFFEQHPAATPLKPRMAQLLTSGAARDLQDAYEQARWSDPAARQALLEEQTRAAVEKAKREEAERLKKAAAADLTGISGSPTDGASTTSAATPEEAVRAAFAEVGY